MQDYVLPKHDFFIYVPVVRGEDYRGDQSKPGNNILHTSEAKEAPVLFQSWTKIALADTFDVYARLERDARSSPISG
jgi:hypothetical protein